MLNPIWIIKVGGSLLASGTLANWLSVIADRVPKSVLGYGSGIILVPGGGFFADQIRIAQKQWQFDDQTAHAMALLAMHQYAHLLQFMQPELVLADSIDVINKTLKKRKIPVWLPHKATVLCPQLPTSWDTSSDSLALWLAGLLDARHLFLIKSRPNEGYGMHQLSELGLLDKAFPGLAEKAVTTVWWLTGQDMSGFGNLLSQADAKPEEYLSADHWIVG